MKNTVIVVISYDEDLSDRTGEMANIHETTNRMYAGVRDVTATVVSPELAAAVGTQLSSDG